MPARSKPWPRWPCSNEPNCPPAKIATRNSGCANRRIDDVAEALRDGAELYRRWYWALTDDHHRDLAGEHLRLRDLALARDADAAVSLLSDHIQRAPLQLIEYAREHGEDALDRPAAPRQARTYTRSAGA